MPNQTTSKTKRVVGVVRVSEVGDRDDNSLHSPDDQAAQIRRASKGSKLVAIHRELDVSGRLPLTKRPGLLAAVETIEAKQANVLMVTYFDRLCRSMKVQQEVVERVEAAGGEVLTLDFGKVSNGTAIQRLTGSLLGAVNEYVAEQIGEKSAAGQRSAVAAGHHCGPTPPGYLRGADKTLVPDPKMAPVAVEAFERRAAGATFAEVQAFLASKGIKRTMSGVRRMLTSRLYLGEINFGTALNPTAHPAIVDPDLFARVQRMVVRAGRKTKSPRLLARLGVLHCGVCGGRMSASSAQGDYRYYRCASQACGKPQNIESGLVENEVIAETKRFLDGIRGEASENDGVIEATAVLERAQAQLDAALTAFADLMAEPAAVERLNGLRAVRDAARERRDELAANSDAKSVAVDAGDWDMLTLAEQRALVKAVIRRVDIRHGHGVGRIVITPRA